MSMACKWVGVSFRRVPVRTLYVLCLVCGGGCGGDAITRYSIQLGMALLFSLFLFLHSRDSFVSSFLKYYIFQN
jgi:hypothetical protein